MGAGLDFSLKQIMEMYIIFRLVSDFVQSLPPPNGNKLYNMFYKFVSLTIGDAKSFMNTFVAAKYPMLQMPPESPKDSSTTTTTTK